jgi:small-conductance mechanosensitive channel
VWTATFLLVLDNLGFDVTALITGLGVGGIAVALAVQNVLGDLFASVSIVIDKPFVVGDSIAIGDFVGTVESVGLKTTRLRSVSGEQIVMANSDLLQSRIRNHKRAVQRRNVFGIGVTYDTPPEQLRRVSEIVREAIEAEGERARFDRAHLMRFGASSLDFEAVWFTLDPDYKLYMDQQERIFLRVLEKLGEAGIELAFPTQTVQIARPTAEELADALPFMGGPRAAERSSAASSST